MKLAAVIIIYKPNLNFLHLNIAKVIDDVDQVFLYQNSLLSESFIEEAFFKDKIQIVGDGNNVGIGLALNNCIKILKQIGFTHMLTLDQDSYFREGDLLVFRDLIKNYSTKNVGVFAPNFNDRGNLLTDRIEIFEASDAITSGSIFPLNIFDKVEGFNNDLFIDTVDQEFCYRINSDFGLKTIIFPSIQLIHELGYPLKIIFGLTTYDYSSFRTYYLVRNHIMLWRKYPKIYKKQYKNTLLKQYIFYRVIKIILGESDKWNKIKSIFNGVHDGLKGKIVI